MNIAVVGAGLFGCTAAIQLARAGHKVDLYDIEEDIFRRATGINQYRLHAGYHYPRSSETIQACRDSVTEFRRFFPDTSRHTADTFYGIAKKGSKVSAKDYLATLDAHKLRYKVEPPITDAYEVFIRVKEYAIDPSHLRSRVFGALEKEGVRMFMRTPAYPEMRDEYDKIVVACYAGNNDVLDCLGCPLEEYQYEVCEKPVIRLERNPEGWRTNHYGHFSCVIMDGDFCSLDPFGQSSMHVMGHVKHAIHAHNTGFFPEVPENLKEYLNRGIIEKPKVSNWKKFKKAALPFFPFLKESMYLGSMFTVRAVLPNLDKTDARPTLVTEIDDKVIRVFSGKLGTAVSAAKQISDKLGTAVQASQTIASMCPPSLVDKIDKTVISEQTPTSRSSKTCKQRSAKQSSPRGRQRWARASK